MCNNMSCPLFNICYRAQAEPNPHRQSYGMFTFEQGAGCAHFWSTGNTRKEVADHSERYIKLRETYGKTIW